MHITKVCTTCYQSIKNLVFNIENIMDTQKILRIENSMKLSPKKEETHTIVEDLARKYTNIKVKKISICSADPVPSVPKTEFPIPQAPREPPKKSAQPTPNPKESPKKLVVIEALPDAEPPPKKSRALMCISCSQKFPDYDQMQNHLKSCKALSNNLKCFCGKILNSKKELALHVYSQHKQNKQNHVCKICQKLFNSMFNLQNHMATHSSPHSPQKGAFSCHYCRGKFLDFESLKKHREVEKCGSKKLSES